MEGAVLFPSGLIYFSTCYLSVKKILEFTYDKILTQADIVCISVKIVSSIQGIMAVIAGMIIVQNCQGDIMYDNHWVTNAYAWFGAPYFFYDLYVMYLEYCCNHPEIADKGRMYSSKEYIRTHRALVMHHIILPVILFPAIVFLRGGAGDFFVGVLFHVELAVPFIAARNILVQLKMKNTKLYVYVGLLMIVMFTVSRILLFPYVYWKYAVYADMAIWKVPFSIPIKCNVGCGSILILQIYWLIKMIKGAVRLFSKSKSTDNGQISVPS